MKKIIVCLLLLFCLACSNKSKPYLVAIDKQWYSVALNGQTEFLNGFITDLLLETAKENKIEIKLISANWDNILEGLSLNKYQAVFSALNPYNFNMAKYDFSDEIIKTGYVLVVGKDKKYKDLNDLKNRHVGYLSGSGSLLILQKYINIFDEAYGSIPVMLGDITKNKIEGAVLSIIPAYKYVSDLFYDELKIIDPTINDQSIRIITIKNENTAFLKMFNVSLKSLEKKGKIKELLIKWGLPN
ncbi:MAG: glutamine-binding protein [uncultured bacterium]|nr:MAG: glutamine-binding protein [uncultured bacterium]